MQAVQSFKAKPGKSTKFGNQVVSVDIMVDGKPLLLQIQQECIRHGFQWIEARNTIVELRALHQSMAEDGYYPILVGIHCLMNNRISPHDVLLSEVKVTHRDNRVQWALSAFSSDDKQDASISFEFDSIQYKKEISKLPASTT